MKQMIENEAVINYLRYLRDISRKIGSRSSFENILHKRGRRSQKTIILPEISTNTVSLNNPIFNELFMLHKYLKKNSDKKLFLGIGLVHNPPKIAGPLLIGECKLYEEKLNLRLEINTSTLILNYDLISKIIENKSSNDDDDINLRIAIERESETLNTIEEELLKPEEPSELNNIADRCIKILKENLPEFKDIEKLELIDIKEELKELSSLLKDIDKKKFTFINTNYLFIASTPSEISTYYSLANLIKEIENESSLQNKTVNKLLISAFSNKIQEVEFEEKVWETIDNIIDPYLPIPISPAQRRALKNAFSYEISYIQGPPGTGKSHTISAIVLTAILLGKKVLVVSQKPPAVEVIKEKVTPYLSFNPEILPVVYFDKDLKQKLRASIKTLLDKYNNQIELNNERISLENKVKQLNEELRKIHEEIELSTQKLKEELNLERELVEISEEFQKIKTHFQEKHYILSTNLKTVPSKIRSKLHVLLEKLRKVENNHFYNRMSLIFLLNSIHNTLKYLPGFSNKKYLIHAAKKRTLSFILEDILELEKKLHELNKIQSMIRGNIELLRKDIIFLKKKRKELQNEYIKSINKLRILNNLARKRSRITLSTLSKLLYYRNPKKINQLQSQINWDKVLETFPIWISEIRHLNEILPMKPELFDLIIVDEASQVNLSEIIPIFYRGKKICIVGDHKQLSLSSTGLTFQLSKNLDRLTWEKYKPGNLSYEEASERNLVVAKSSILDFIRTENNNLNVPEVMLDEHFRSFPALASFTNDKFYNGKLKIMTETPDKALINCFLPIRVNGIRDKDKTIKEEAVKVVEIIKSLISTKSFNGVKLPDIVPHDFSIGVISMIRNQVELIKDIIEEELSTEEVNKYKIIVGTPEELQGHERDVMIFSLCIDRNSYRSAHFYQENRRFNVATSRAKYFTFTVYSEIPHTFNLVRSYFNHFNYNPELINISEIKLSENPLNWKFDPNAYESEFEKIVYSFLKKYIDEKRPKCNLRIFNQVRACGQKRLDFVIYNPKNKKFVAVEVDGIHHFEADGKTYSQAHLERMEILERAGWKIINTPYHKWFKNGWLDEKSEILKEELKRIYSELDKYLSC